MALDGRDERWYEPELYRLKGVFLLGRDPPDPIAAEAAFRRAMDRAREQRARSWELRAAVSLARLQASTGRHADGLRLLAEIHSAMTEGFDTPDWREAKALLENDMTRQYKATENKPCPS